jgi:hypothetical protein
MLKRFRFLALVVLVVVIAIVAVGQTTDPTTPAPTDWWMIALGALLALSEVLALIPSIASNSIFTLIVNLLRRLAGKPPIAVATPSGTKIIGG